MATIDYLDQKEKAYGTVVNKKLNIDGKSMSLVFFWYVYRTANKLFSVLIQLNLGLLAADACV